MDIENRIIEYVPAVDPVSLTPHEQNARVHPTDQRDALAESLGRVGWLSPVVVNRTTGNILDGHLRVEDAIARGATVPVVYVEVAEDDEEFVLATFDPIAALAEYNGGLLGGLLERASIQTAPLLALLNDRVALSVGPPPLDDLADEYEPPLPPEDPTAGWLRLEVGPPLVDVWREYRAGFDSDAAAFGALLDR